MNSTVFSQKKSVYNEKPEKRTIIYYMNKLITLFLIIHTTGIYAQFVNPHDEKKKKQTTQNFSTYTPIENKKQKKFLENNKNTKIKTIRKTIKTEKADYINKKKSVRNTYFNKMKFTFDGKITFLGSPTNIKPLRGFIAHYDIKDRLICVEYFGKRAFEIYIKYGNNSTKLEMIWVHNKYHFIKYVFGEKKRFFMKMDMFNFIKENNKELILPELLTNQKKYFLRMDTDRFMKIKFSIEIKKQDLNKTRKYYEVLINNEGLWHTANYYKLNRTDYIFKTSYSAFYYKKNKKFKNIRYFDIKKGKRIERILDRSFFYDYNEKSCLKNWDLYLLDGKSYWEILYETWTFECSNGELSVKERENIYTDKYIRSLFVSIHFKSWLKNSDHFSSQGDYLSKTGLNAGNPGIFGGALSLFIPTVKNLFLTIEFGWDGMWDSDNGWRYTLNMFNISANALFLIPLYQDTFSISLYLGGGIALLAADFTQVYNTGALTLAKQRATDSTLMFNIRLGVALTFSAGMFGIGARFNLGKLSEFESGDSKLYYSSSEGLRVYDPGSQPSGAKKAEISLYRFVFEIFFAIRL